jgi:hypothetical protein
LFHLFLSSSLALTIWPKQKNKRERIIVEINVIFIQNATAYSQAGKMLMFVWKDGNLVETKIDKQIQPDYGIATISDLFENDV